MPHGGEPTWPGALWIGSVELTDLQTTDELHLNDTDGYARARLLVREAGSVRGFIEMPIDDERIDSASALREAELLPASVAATEPKPLPRVSVVICTRDRPQHLRTSLAAVLAVDYPDFEVIVVDNASRTTATADLVRDEFADPRIRLLIEPTPGLASARNTGLLAATGEIVAFTDDDVIADASWLRQIAAGFALSPEVHCVSGLVPSGELRTAVQRYFDDRVSWSRNLAPRIYRLSDPPADLPMFPFCIGEFGTGANFALRREAAWRLRGFDTAFGVGTRTGGGEDIDIFTRVILAGGTLVVQPSAIIWHRHRDDLKALRVQAEGYGVGLGAWLTKLAFHPKTLVMATARSPRALQRLVSLAWRRPESSLGAAEEQPEDFGRETSTVGWLELLSVARGPWRYFLQRRAKAGLIPRAALDDAHARLRASTR